MLLVIFENCLALSTILAKESCVFAAPLDISFNPLGAVTPNSFKVFSKAIGYCAECIRTHFDEIWPEIKKVHAKSRGAYDLPTQPPRAAEGLACGLCFHSCRILEGETGFCGQRQVKNGRIRGGRPHEGNLSFYYDPLPTNCVADFVCQMDIK